MKHPPLLVADISDWVSQVLPHTVWIHDWASFNKKFGPKPPIGSRIPFFNYFDLTTVLLFSFTYSFPLVLGRRSSGKAKAPIPLFRQAVASAGLEFVLIEYVQNYSSKTLTSSGSGRRVAAPPMEIPASPVLHLVDESLPSEEDVAPLKRRRVEIGGLATAVAVPKSDAILDGESARPLVTETVLLLEVTVEGRPLVTTEVVIGRRVVRGSEDRIFVHLGERKSCSCGQRWVRF